jgi:hypothetical protein
MMPADSVLCISCGYNVETGRMVKGATAKKSATVAAVTKIAKSGGAFLLGCLFSGIGAIIGATVWVVVAVVTHYQIGWIAWGLGAMAGLGMLWGYGESNTRAGFTAACIALAGIFAAKFGVFLFVIYSIFTGSSSDIRVMREFVTLNVAREILAEKGKSIADTKDPEWNPAFEEARKRVARMSDAEVQKLHREGREDLDAASAYTSEFGAKRARLARHRATRRAEQMGLTDSDPQRQRLYKEEFTKTKDTPESELDTALTELDAWEKDGRWSDAEYLHDHLVYAIVNEQIEQTPAAKLPDWKLTDEEWKKLHATATREVDKMSLDERRDFLRKLEALREKETRLERLARHESWLQAMEMGLPYGDPKREMLFKAATVRCKMLKPEELQTRIAELDAWEAGGSETDARYMRNQLVYRYIDDAEAESDADFDESDGDDSAGDAEWKKRYDEAVAKVDAIPPDQYALKMKELDAAEERRWKQLEEAQENEDEAETTDFDFGEFFWAFFNAMFGPLDALFLLLAIGSAFRIASSSGT